MAKLLITRTLCDVCAADDTEADGMTVTWSDIGMELDLCEDHAKQVTAVRDMFQEYGGKIGRAGKPGNYRNAERDPQECPECGRTYKNRTSLATHLRTQHDTSIGTVEGIAASFECPDCDRSFTTPQGLGAHRRAVHGTIGQGSRSAVA